MISKHLEEIQNVLDPLSKKIRKLLPMGDYELGPNKTFMYDFCQVHRISSPIKIEAATGAVL